jgi:hypothetical protein
MLPIECVVEWAAVSRFFLVSIVVALTFSATGVSSLIVPEPCTATKPATSDDRSCPPLCVTCGCCAQAVEPAVLLVSATPEPVTARVTEFVSWIPESEPRRILHVPKARLV